VAEELAHLHIIGPGRAGVALGAALLEAQAVGRLSYGGRAANPPDHPLFRRGPASPSYSAGVAPPYGSPPTVVLLAVPDDHITAVAVELGGARQGAGFGASWPVLHLSGAFGSELLAPLARLGHPTGSLHPLAALPDADAGVRLRGAWFAVEGAPAAAEAARAIVGALGGRVLQLDAAGKAVYHAAAVAASNYVVALMGVAERWMGAAGVPPADAREALAVLARGAVENVERLGPEQALTGPVARGDEATIRAHLARLSAGDRYLYSVLADSALTLARRRGLDPATADRLARLLESTE
jgi:predicted short-subunit dehydrogenase-like oxidoreductase (DUF2520 family)